MIRYEVDAILLQSTVFCSKQRLGAVPTNKDSMSTQITQSSPSRRARVQVCLKDVKSNSPNIYSKVFPGNWIHEANNLFDYQQFITTLN